MKILYLVCLLISVNFVFGDIGFLAEMFGLNDESSQNNIHAYKKSTESKKKLLQMTNVQHLINKKWRNGSDELNVKKVMKQFYDTVNDIYLKTGGIDKFNSTIPKSFPKLLVEDWKQYFTETDKTLNRKEMKDLQEITNIKDSTDQISKEITDDVVLVDKKIEVSHPEVMVLKPSGIDSKDYPKFVATVQNWIENLTWNETRDDRNDDDEQDDDENDFKMELLPEGPGQDEKKIINPKKDSEEIEMEELIRTNFVKPHTEYGSYLKDKYGEKKEFSEINQEKRDNWSKKSEKEFADQENIQKIKEHKDFKVLQWRQVKKILEQRMNKFAKLLGKM